MMVAPTDKTDYQICKAGMKAVNGRHCHDDKTATDGSLKSHTDKGKHIE
ncbi:hypothetical protein [Nostoc sp. 'Peltigera membranacea cyanobiont' 232]|nr:hypothetical protein [Nostoc sp. 'Peltigera membranacea cyanobiont' 232]